MTIDNALNVIDETSKHISKDNLNRYIKNHYNDIYLLIESLTINLNQYKTIVNGKQKDISIFERLYCIKNNIADRPLCKTCKTNHVRWINHENRYADYCCVKCGSNASSIEKAKLTKLAKYGSANYNGNDKAKVTRLEKYGAYHTTDFSTKVKNTKKLHFGDENFVNSTKSKLTKLKRYGSESFNNIEKTKLTKLEKYGSEFYNNREKFMSTVENFSDEKKLDIKEKRKDSNILKYGHEFATLNAEIRAKITETSMLKYGVSSYLATDECQSKARIARRTHSYNEFILKDSNAEPLFSLDEFVNCVDLEHTYLKFKCKNCGLIFESRWDDGHHSLCTHCFPYNGGISEGEKLICEYIKTIYSGKVIENSKSIISPLELDIYLPEKKIAIEYDGLYYHNSNLKDRKYHLNKTIECEKLGIRLIHIFENEWLYRTDIVKSRIRNILGIFDKTVFARKCTIEIAPSLIAADFNISNHLLGNKNASVNVGLYYDNELVSLMTFGKPRYNKKIEWELLRFSNKLGYHVIGAAGKLLKWFERNYNPTSLISYADRRWSQGNVYDAIGFKLDHISDIDYWYWKDRSKLYHRTSFLKHKLNDILVHYDSTKTVELNIIDNGYLKIFDCGNMVFIKRY